jgi:hypothetical protein
MANIFVRGNDTDSGSSSAGGRLGGLERYVLRRAHPVSIFIDTVGLIWFIYYLWMNLWQEAVAVLIFARLCANAATVRAHSDRLSQTILGKIALLHLHPVNLFLQIVGTAVAIDGVWTHRSMVILAALSLILLGHLQGWPQVDRRFELL